MIKVSGFNFKTEAIWMLIFGLGSLVAGLLITLVVVGLSSRR